MTIPRANLASLASLVILVGLTATAAADGAGPKAPACTKAAWDAHVKRGAEALANGMTAVALAELEKALACRPDDASIYPRLVLAACKLPNAQKAQRYYAKCGASACRVLQERCKSFHIDLK